MLKSELLAAEEVWVRASQQLRRAMDYSEGLELLPEMRQDLLARADPLFYRRVRAAGRSRRTPTRS